MSAVPPGPGATRSVDRYAVVGHPVAHSRSPGIHHAFARQVGQELAYERLLAPLDGFEATVRDFIAAGGRGLNVTVPFKREAFALCEDRLSARARLAGAVNTLVAHDSGIAGDNTDGVGLVADLVRLGADLDLALPGAHVLMVGAGGAARGVIGPLLDAGVDRLTVVNRTAANAHAMVAAFDPTAALAVATFDELREQRFDIVVNATSSSLAKDPLPLPADLLAEAQLAYDMMYGAEPTAFMRDASRAGTRHVVDGLGMLVEQAAEAFAIWRGVRPETAPVLAALRADLRSAPT